MASGHNSQGQLGDGTLEHQLTFQPVNMNNDSNTPFIDPDDSDFGWPNSAVIDSNGKLWLSGANASGQLGNGTTSIEKQLEFKIIPSIDGDQNYQATDVLIGEHYIVVQIGNSLYASGNGPCFGITGNFSEFTKIEFLQNEKLKKIDVGAYHLGVLMESGNLYLNGLNTFGQLGNGANLGSWTTPVNTKVKDFSTGTSNTIILMNDGSLMSAGRNTEGQLGLGESGQSEGVDVDQFTFQNVPITLDDIISVQGGYYHSSFLTSSGNLYFTGRDLVGEFGDGPTPSSRNTFEITHSNVKYFDLGAYHSLIVTDGNKILLFGDNTYGNLGNDTTTSIHDAYSPEADRTNDFPPIPTPTPNPPATQIFLLIYFTM